MEDHYFLIKDNGTKPSTSTSNVNRKRKRKGISAIANFLDPGRSTLVDSTLNSFLVTVCHLCSGGTLKAKENNFSTLSSRELKVSDVYHEPGSVENGCKADYQEKHTPEFIRHCDQGKLVTLISVKRRHTALL